MWVRSLSHGGSHGGSHMVENAHTQESQAEGPYLKGPWRGGGLKPVTHRQAEQLGPEGVSNVLSQSNDH